MDAHWGQEGNCNKYWVKFILITAQEVLLKKI